MVSFNESENIYFRGKKIEKAAYIEVKIAGTAEREHKNKITNLLCNLFETQLCMPKDSIYITFTEVEDWGWNGRLF